MDLLTHLFLPITVAYVVRPALFPSPSYLLLAGFAVLPDIDKLLGLQGALHSIITLGLLGGIVFVAERWHRDDSTYAIVIITLLFSHLLLDFLNGGPVTFLYPLSNVGFGLTYPTELVLGDTVGTTGVRNPAPAVATDAPNRSRAAYPLVNGYGVLSGLTFLIIYARGSLSERLSVRGPDRET
ncbi:metal-dependent hydrolase [Natrinema soli]|uniref:Metal-dependent hydrolase n=1 Tax=Natrinema soli TaxID=1930624 RepID=A0ABD5SP02_9EURY|nr:metal-dependent hydrolase [Natrinema soli]